MYPECNGETSSFGRDFDARIDIRITRVKIRTPRVSFYHVLMLEHNRYYVSSNN